MVAGTLGMLTLAIAIWTLLVERRRWLRWLAIGAFCTFITQATLGGMTVLFFQPPWLSTAHATVAQTFFCIAVAIALFTGRQWVEDPADRPGKDRPGKDQPRAEFDSRHPSLFTLTLLSIVVLYVQLILGGMFRHHGMSWWPHVLNAVDCFVRAGLDRNPRDLGLFEYRRSTPSGNRDALASDHAALPGLHSFPHARSLGTRRSPTGTPHGRLHGSACSGRRAAAGNDSSSGDSSVAQRPSRFSRARPARAAGCFRRMSVALRAAATARQMSS